MPFRHGPSALCRHGPSVLFPQTLMLCHHRPCVRRRGPSALPRQAFGLTSGKGGLVRLGCRGGELLLLVRAIALSNVVGQTPSYCFAVPPPSSGPLVLSLLFARKPVGAGHSRFGQPSPNILPRATGRVLRSTARQEQKIEEYLLFSYRFAIFVILNY